jgi:hypothetical protein
MPGLAYNHADVVRNNSRSDPIPRPQPPYIARIDRSGPRHGESGPAAGMGPEPYGQVLQVNGRNRFKGAKRDDRTV